MARRNRPGGILAGNPLKPVCIAGLVLALIVSWGLVLFGVIWGGEIAGGEIRRNAFSRELEEYDFFDAPKRALEGENPEQIERRLSRLQKQVGGVEEQLSVLKRRRVLALADRRYIPAYEKAACAAAETFVHSAPIAAVAVDALVLGTFPLPEEARGLLKIYAARLSQNRFELPELSAYILAGELENPADAAALPGIEALLAIDAADPGAEPQSWRAQAAHSVLPANIRNILLLDEFLLRAARGDTMEASAKLNVLLTAPGFERMAAEFFYDHHNPHRAAELFLRLSGERDEARAADSWVLAGEMPGARNIWRALAGGEVPSESGRPVEAPGETGNPGAALDIRYRSLYNLAATSADRREEQFWLDKIGALASQRGQPPPGSLGTYSIIRYSRLFEQPRGIEVLEENVRQSPLLDLELLRRRLDSWPPTRAAAEIWLLLGRHSDDEALYEWAAWYFDHQRLDGEAAQLLKEASRKGMTGPWLDLHRGLAFLREGKTQEGEKILKEAGSRSTDWRIPANLGRIQESRRAISSALEYYESAASLVKEKTAAALLQVRLSRCFEALGQIRESRRALETAQEFDPANLNIRRELRRFDSQ